MVRICQICGREVHDFHGDAVWRDGRGSLTCDHAPAMPGSTFHEPAREVKSDER